MFRKIAQTAGLPAWMSREGRFWKLTLYGRLLDGTFYDHLPNAFYDEQSVNGTLIPLTQRRPSSQYRLCAMVARQTARQLFAGRHQPKVRHPDKATQRRIEEIVKETSLWRVMLEAATVGSVGSVAVTFRVGNGIPALRVWRPQWITPSFDPASGALVRLRLHYTTTGAEILNLPSAATLPKPQDILPQANYWFVRDYGPDAEVTYLPVRESDWNPAQGFIHDGEFEPWPGEIYEHALGYVPGVWIRNLSGGAEPDGESTFAPAIPNAIEIDYTLSQAGRGARYNSAPQLFIKGQILNFDNEVVRGPSFYIHGAPDHRDENGAMVGGADAKLLEVSGQGAKSALDIAEKLRDMALEQIAASRKNPDRMKGPLSGIAMQYLDEESDNLVMELRTSYGDQGALPLIRRLVSVMQPDADVSGLILQWPRLFQPTPDEILTLVTALRQAVAPIMETAPKGETLPPRADPEKASGSTTSVAPAEPANTPEAKALGSLLTLEEAQAYLRANMDFATVDIGTDEESAPQQSVAVASTEPEPSSGSAPGAVIGKVGPMWNILAPLDGPYSER